MRVAVVVVVCVASATSVGRAAPAPRTLPGWPLYDRLCLACHGAAGDGEGPGAALVRGRPTAFARGVFAWRSTAPGQPPTADDLRAAIRYGVRGTSMPAFDGILDDAALVQLVAVVRAFAPDVFAHRAVPVELGPPPPVAAARGAALWDRLGCAACHGEAGRGDGPAAHALDPRPSDLADDVLRRPRATDDAAARRRAAALTIATGIAGTAMQGYAGHVAPADVWALADHVLVLGAHAHAPDPRVLDPAAIAADAAHPLPVGASWGAPEDAVFPVAPQGAPLPALAPAEASLSSRQCGRCHPSQVRAWRGSIHAASAGAGLAAQRSDHGGTCARCHAPLAEQATDPTLRAEGVTCAGCHVRAWVRGGPPPDARSLAPLPGYPHEVRAVYERADFCAPCHQLPPRLAVAGKPLLDTYREWLLGPYQRRGIPCQSCHMAERGHQWLGVHDRATFREAIRLDARARRVGGRVEAIATLANVGAGHDLPTTPTPAVWLRVELVDAHGRPIAGARAERRIGRDLSADAAGWHERADTRIPPGGQMTLAHAWWGGRTGEAVAARVTVEVAPDDYYERLYARQLARPLPAAERALYEQALARARKAHYIAEQREVPVAL